MNRIFIFLICIFLAYSCGEPVKLQSERKSELRQLLKSRVKNDVMSAYSYENMRIGITGKLNITGNGKLFINTGNFVFLTVQLYGAELSRLLITKDSVFFINRIESNYLFISFEEIQRLYSKRIDYKLIENLLIKSLLLPDNINFRMLYRFFEYSDSMFVFSLKSDDNASLFKYDNDFFLKNIELYNKSSKNYFTAELHYLNSVVNEMIINGFLGNVKLNGLITPGIRGNNSIERPGMNINRHYREINF